MTIVLLFAIALLLTSVAGSVALWNLSGETRVGLFGALFAIVAAHQGFVLGSEWGAPLEMNSATFGAFAGLAAGVLSLFVVVAVWRTLGERDRVETLHWDSMETVRVLNELTDDDRAPYGAKVA